MISLFENDIKMLVFATDMEPTRIQTVLDIRDAIITSDRRFRQQKEASGMLFFTPDAFVTRLRGR